MAVPHASVCGGRGRCSTCRVRDQPRHAKLPPPLRRGARARPDRRAAQRAPGLPDAAAGDIAVGAAAAARSGAADGAAAVDPLQGQEQEIAILFADLRGFTTIAEHELPYDVVFVLNRYFGRWAGGRESGGHVDKFIGDGVMALFGIEGEPAKAAGRRWPRRAPWRSAMLAT